MSKTRKSSSFNLYFAHTFREQIFEGFFPPYVNSAQHTALFDIHFNFIVMDQK